MTSKFLNGETYAEYRAKRKASRQNAERAVKAAIRRRDGIGCRWPDCQFWKRGFRVDAAHLDDKGMGGDPKLIRTQTSTVMRICVQHHTGPESLHSGDLRIVPLTDRGADGPCQFERRNWKSLHGWEVVGGEDSFSFAARSTMTVEDADADGGDEY